MSTERLRTTKAGNAASALELFTNIPRFRLLNLNTPVERLDRLRRAIPGAPQLWIKRDDLTGYLGGGNKLRKLEYVMADALSRGCGFNRLLPGKTIQKNRPSALLAYRWSVDIIVRFDGTYSEATTLTTKLLTRRNVPVYIGQHTFPHSKPI